MLTDPKIDNLNISGTVTIITDMKKVLLQLILINLKNKYIQTVIFERKNKRSYETLNPLKHFLYVYNNTFKKLSHF